MPVPPVIQMYRYVMGSGGGGLGNLLKASEEFQQTRNWVRYPTNSQTPTVNDDSRPDPNGGTTADQVGLTANTSARLQQTVTLSPSTQYTFSVHARAVSGTVDFRMRNVTLKDAEVKTATTTGPLTNGFTRFTYTFTTNAAGPYELALQNDTNATAKDVIFWGAMLNQGGTALDYEYAAPTTGGSAPAPAYAGFGDAFGGVTAYYSLRQFTEAETLNAIRVRRSSDDTEQDQGFDSNGDLDTTALLAFVNADVDTYTSDFTSGTDSFTEHSTTNAGNIDGISDGTTLKNDVLRVTMSGGSTSHQIRRANIFDGANTYDISFEYYIPSSNTKLDQIIFRTNVGGDGDTAFSNVGTWSTGSISDFTPSGTQVRFNATDGGAFIFDADGDVFYLKNIVVTQTTADGAITTFYDQTGNGNNATNSTESEQPLVVSAGTLVTENVKAAIDFDGTDDHFDVSGVSAFDPFYVSLVAKFDTTGHVLGTTLNTDTLRLRLDTQFRTKIANNDVDFTVASTTGVHSLITWRKDASNNNDLAVNGVDATTGVQSGNLDLNFIGRSSSNYFNGKIQELIIFDSDQSANRTGMETNINDHFDIYP